MFYVCLSDEIITAVRGNRVDTNVEEVLIVDVVRYLVNNVWKVCVVHLCAGR